MNIKGIDVSQWQGNIDFAKVKKSGINFVIIRAGYGRYISQKDPYFEKNYTRAKTAGLNVGVYWYSYAVNVAQAQEEAKVCLEAIKGKQFEMPIYFDLEERDAFARGKTVCSDMVKAFCNTLEKAGYFAGLYISRSPLQTYITSEVTNRYALWIAEYNSSLNWNGNVGIWQYSANGQITGIAGNVDMDIAYIDYPSIITAGGFNGFKKSNVASGQNKNAGEAGEAGKAGEASKNTAAKPADKKIQSQADSKKTTVTYTVKKGDTLWDIAQKYKTTVEALAKKNNIKNVDMIYPGQKLII